MSEMPQRVLRRSWWRRFRFGVRALMIFVLIIGAGIGWVVRRAQVQRDAVAAIQRAGGTIRYDFQLQGLFPNPSGKPRAPRWLVERLGVDYFANVVYVALPKASDAELAHIGKLARLEWLFLGGSTVTDKGWTSLDELPNLQVLSLAGASIGDAGMVHVRGLLRLKSLTLHSTKVSDAGLANVRRLVRLEKLNLANTKITDAGLVHLMGLTKLQRLYVRSNLIVRGSSLDALRKAIPKLEIDY
jgi:hypothetical protein